MSHPIRDAELHIFERCDGGANGPQHIARFWPYQTWPIFFAADGYFDVQWKAEDFRADVIAKNEAAVIARQEALAKARAARKKKDTAE